MRLLLLLSAFLTALVGQGGVARAAVMPSASVSASTQVATERSTRVPVLFDAVEQAVSNLINFDQAAPVSVPVARVPIYQDRLLI